jgi:hypothetical protein
MNPGLRAVIANIAARLAGQNVNSAVYDHTQGKHIHVSGNISATSVAIYDHDRNDHISGTHTNLYDHNLNAHLSLNMNGSHFTGYDYGSGFHYSGHINCHLVTIFDNENNQHHQYTV